MPDRGRQRRQSLQILLVNTGGRRQALKQRPP
jgi:hypothetical protein